MALHHLTQAEYVLISGYFRVSYNWITQNSDMLKILSAKGQENLDYFTAHPLERPQPQHMLLGMFLMCCGELTRHFDAVVKAEHAIQTPFSPEDAKAQVKAMLTKIKSEL